MNTRLFWSCILLSISTLASASALSTEQRVDSLRENACAIVNDYSAVFSQADLNNATFTVTKVITILNKQGEGNGNFYEVYDKFKELKDFSGIVRNSSGTIVKKIGKKDLTTSSISEHLSTDSYTIYYECKQPTFPYIVEYTYQEKWKNGILYYPPFFPVSSRMVSVEKADYKLELPEGMNLRYNSNFDCVVSDNTIGNKHIYSVSTEGLKAIDREPLEPAFLELMPRVLFMPTDFCYDSSCGNLSDWKSYGIWISSLLKGRDVLPAEYINTIKELTKDAKSDKEKVNILYQYLQNNYRYVSIQLGIGGFQPIDAATVVRSKFGDCKGLTNIMMAMLKEIDIPSNYCVIGTRTKDVLPDFPNFNQLDHVILLVPLQNDSVWLECTNSKIPFGYIHDNIAGHNTIIINEKGGELYRLPTYSDQLNKKESKLDINISEDGSAKGKICFVEHLHHYGDNFYRMTSKDREKEMRYINENINMPKVQVSQIEVSENRSELPSCSLSANFEASEFTNKTGTRLFASACPLRKGNYNIFTAASRKQDIVINNGYSESDTITFHIPESYTVESAPKDISVKTPYGIFETQCSTEGNTIIYTQNIDIYSGRYDKAQYKDIKAFYNEINSAIKRRLVLKKI
ncbi:DUF3857 domain-containing protein [Dysgonomonas sp. 521]|uniref:DUF3857 domain-containing protein n=1 Tax=Dysgonomonas sp. 521 TaxID=2302932 RepID=UPI0013D12789|nr:DUF3857 domain-containing protein [Dysgonomonas sp. 521]NDV94095.1 DUF3857 domain-containing protein [Dysgonomonas sp. 521]